MFLQIFINFIEKKVNVQAIIKFQRLARTWLKKKKKQKNLYFASFEVLETERSYVESLILTITKFKEPLLQEHKNIGISKSEVDHLFGNIQVTISLLF
jgi:hypothetical protein